RVEKRKLSDSSEKRKTLARVIDWSTVGLGGGQLLTGLDFAGGTAEASAGNASGSR
ncbi:uncharacterized protein E0L32_012460, partial [Thyridium curvatum]